MLDLPMNKISVISSYVGGQFGRGDTGEQPFFFSRRCSPGKRAGR